MPKPVSFAIVWDSGQTESVPITTDLIPYIRKRLKVPMASNISLIANELTKENRRFSAFVDRLPVASIVVEVEGGDACMPS